MADNKNTRKRRRGRGGQQGSSNLPQPQSPASPAQAAPSPPIQAAPSPRVRAVPSPLTRAAQSPVNRASSSSGVQATFPSSQATRAKLPKTSTPTSTHSAVLPLSRSIPSPLSQAAALSPSTQASITESAAAEFTTAVEDASSSIKSSTTEAAKTESATAAQRASSSESAKEAEVTPSSTKTSTTDLAKPESTTAVEGTSSTTQDSTTESAKIESATVAEDASSSTKTSTTEVAKSESATEVEDPSSSTQTSTTEATKTESATEVEDPSTSTQTSTTDVAKTESASAVEGASSSTKTSTTDLAKTKSASAVAGASSSSKPSTTEPAKTESAAAVEVAPSSTNTSTTESAITESASAADQDSSTSGTAVAPVQLINEASSSRNVLEEACSGLSDRERQTVHAFSSHLLHVLKCWYARETWKEKKHVRSRNRTDIEVLECPYPDCESIRNIVEHATRCRAPGQSCIIDFCNSYTFLLRHWASCREEDCETCQIREIIELEQRRIEEEIHRAPVRVGPLPQDLSRNVEPLDLDLRSDLDDFVTEEYRRYAQAVTQLPQMAIFLWHDHMSMEDRSYVITRLMMAVLPGLDFNEILDRRVQHLLEYACRMEFEIFDRSCDIMEYGHRVKEAINQIEREFQEYCEREEHLHSATGRSEIRVPSQRQSTFRCSACDADLDTRYRCNQCENFELCPRCFFRVSHPHRLQRYDFDMRGYPTAVFSQSIYQLSRHLRLQHCVQQLTRSSRCIHPYCRDSSCIKYRALIQHARYCRSPPDVICHHCQQIIGLCRYHARQCLDDQCPVPFCLQIRQALGQPRMDEYDIDKLADRLKVLYLMESLLQSGPIPRVIEVEPQHLQPADQQPENQQLQIPHEPTENPQSPEQQPENPQPPDL